MSSCLHADEKRATSAREMATKLQLPYTHTETKGYKGPSRRQFSPEDVRGCGKTIALQVAQLQIADYTKGFAFLLI